MSPLYLIGPLCFTLSRFGLARSLFFFVRQRCLSARFPTRTGQDRQTDRQRIANPTYLPTYLPSPSQLAKRGWGGVGVAFVQARRIFPDTYLNAQVWTSRTSGNAPDPILPSGTRPDQPSLSAYYSRRVKPRLGLLRFVCRAARTTTPALPVRSLSVASNTN